MTARASTPEYSCGACRELVMRTFEPAELALHPTCIACGRVVCEECELLGYCPRCAHVLWTPPDDEITDEPRTLVVVGGCSVPGSRPEVAARTQPCRESADDLAS